MKLALLQTPVTFDKAQNVANACQAVRQAAQNGAQLLVLPEMFCCPYSNAFFRDYAEPAGGAVYTAMADLAKELGVCLVAGSMPEREDDKVYNTAFVFGPEGQLLARHRKMHLFDVAFEGGQVFRESATFTAGDDVTLFDYNGLRFGLCVCFDLRFPELSRLMALRGAQALIVPAAFNMTTGPLHWELLFRQRAVDNQLYTLGVAPARDENGPYVSYGNSLLCAPMGQVLARADAAPAILYGDIDPDVIARTRRQLPLLSARREDIYRLEKQLLSS